MEYEWDNEKRAINLAKHQMDFVEVPCVFEGLTFEREDTRRDYGETRIVALGILKTDAVVVVYTMRGERRRLISARKADDNEKDLYFCWLKSGDAS